MNSKIIKEFSCLNASNNFQEIRRKIDLQWEELKNDIDKFALVMIDQTKEFELLFMKQLESEDEIATHLIANYDLVYETYLDPEALLQLESK